MRSLILGLGLIGQAACSPLGPLATVPNASGPAINGYIPGVAQLEMISVMGTDKTVLDHIISLSSGKDCSSVNIEKGEYYCSEDQPQINQDIYCYNTLGSVTCYTKQDMRGNYQRLGRNQHDLLKPIPVNRP